MRNLSAMLRSPPCFVKAHALALGLPVCLRMTQQFRRTSSSVTARFSASPIRSSNIELQHITRRLALKSRGAFPITPCCVGQRRDWHVAPYTSDWVVCCSMKVSGTSNGCASISWRMTSLRRRYPIRDVPAPLSFRAPSRATCRASRTPRLNSWPTRRPTPVES